MSVFDCLDMGSVARERGRMYHRFMVVTGDSNAQGLLVLGVGNALKGDDGVGPYVATGLVATCAEPAGGASTPRVHAIDCGAVPENYTSTIRRIGPRLLVIVDAAEMGLGVGECRAIPPDLVGRLGLSTHSMPLSLFMTYVSEMVGSILLIGVQPRSMLLGAGLSPEVRATGDMLIALLSQERIGEVRGLG